MTRPAFAIVWACEQFVDELRIGSIRVLRKLGNKLVDIGRIWGQPDDVKVSPPNQGSRIRVGVRDDTGGFLSSSNEMVDGITCPF